MANNVDLDHTAPIGAVCSSLGPHFLLVYLNSPVMLGNYLQQKTSAEDIFRCIFLGALRANIGSQDFDRGISQKSRNRHD